jgi:hypothetical protein
MRTTPVLKLLLASNLCLAAAAAAAQEPARAPALPENPLPATSAPEPKQLPAAPSHDDLQVCLKETGDYVTRGKTVLYVIGLANSCDRRLRCEIFANVSGSRGSALGHTIMTLGAAGSGPAAKQTYTMHVKAAGGIAQISRECKVL